MFTPAIYFNFNRKCVLLVNDAEGGKAEYVEFASRKIQLVATPSAKFHSDYKISTESKPAAELALSMLKLTSNGVSITPAARFALEQVTHHPTTQEAPMAIPTTLKPISKKAPAKTAPKGTKKLSEMIDEDEAPLFNVTPDGHAVSNTPEPAPQKAPQALKAAPRPVAAPALVEVTTEEPETSQDEPSTVAQQAAQIVADAQAEATQLIAEMKAMLEDAKRKAEEKKLLEKAKADAKKILDGAKAEVEKFKAQMKALISGAKAPRGKKADAEPKVRGEKVDMSGKKIKLIELPPTREGSARGALAIAVCESKTTDEALEYQGVNASFIQKLVDKGYIEVV